MDFDESIGAVEHRLGLPRNGEVARVKRATLPTLGPRIPTRNTENLAASLSMEVKWYLTGTVHDHGQRTDRHAFVPCGSEIGVTERSVAANHARTLLNLVESVVPAVDLKELRDELFESEDHGGKLFAINDAGGWYGPYEAQTSSGLQHLIRGDERCQTETVAHQ